MSPRSGFMILVSAGSAIVGFTVWMARQDRTAQMRRVHLETPAAAGIRADPPNAKKAPPAAPAAPRPSVANVTARGIQDRGTVRAAENAKIRQDLAAGKPAPLPDSLKVADLPLATSPPGPVAQTEE